MVVFPHAKINLGLNVVRKRPDRFHDIESVLVPIPLCDVLEAVVDPDQSEVIYTRSGLAIPGDLRNDLCLRAIEQIRKVRKLPGIRLHLHKVIPMGAGLGGGSSDGAFTLSLLNELLELDLNSSALHAMATTLGSDCAFFLGEGPQLAMGRGEELRPVPLDLGGLHILLINPGIHVATSDVFAHTAPTGTSWILEQLLDQDRIADWQGTIVNTMESYVFRKYPELAAIKNALLAHGAIYAAMSGSGSTVFGLFNSLPEKLDLPVGQMQWVFSL